MNHAVLDRSFSIDPAGLLPPITSENAPFWDGLVQGRLMLQGCQSCRKLRYPIAPVCPACGGAQFDWDEASGRGKVFSWVRYHRSYLPEFADRLPYIVALVELDEGPRLFAHLINGEFDPFIGQPVRLVIERWPTGRCVASFTSSGAEL